MLTSHDSGPAGPRRDLIHVLCRHPAALAALLALVFVCMAWAQRTMVDDAFISFRYAANLIHGHGLVWNPGETPVEGFTNFLWVLIVAAGIAAGMDPVFFTTLLGMALFTSAIIVQYVLGSRLTGGKWDGAMAVLILGGFHSYRGFATGGLETMLQSLLVLALFLLIVSPSGTDRISDGLLFLISVTSAAAILTRIDSVLLAAVPVAWAAARVFRQRPPGTRLPALSALFGPLALILTSWTAWRISYYGLLLPNTYYAKVSGPMVGPSGFRYLHHFLFSYFLYPFVPLFALAAVLRRRSAPTAVWAMAASVALWAAYMIRIDGDFMEYRFLVPIMPFLAILIMWTIRELPMSLPIKGLLVLLVLAGSFHHQMTHRATPENSLPESTRQLNMRLADEGDAWVSIGRSLGRLFGDAGPEPVTIAVTAAGAIPYYSGLRTVDMLGLSDPWIIRNGLFTTGNAPGHRRVASVDHLRDRGVHLMLGHPATVDMMDRPSEYLRWAIELASFMEKENMRQLSPVVRIVEIPVTPSRKLLAVYLTGHARIDDLISRGILRSYQVRIDTRGFGQDPPAATGLGGS